MAVKSGFFDASYDPETGEYDRVYLSDDMSQFFKVITGNGIFKNEGNALEVIPSGAGMSVSVDTGFATAYGRYIHNTERYVLDIDASDTQGRIDIVVARLSTLQNERNFELIIKKGTPSLAPVAPSLTRNEVIYELCLAKINIPANASSITSEMIEDTRTDKDLCGFVSGLGGGAEIIDCIINDEADLYSSIWLLDEEGNSFLPEAKKMYRVITSGKYKNCVYVFNPTSNKYEGIASYEVELSAQEALALWNSTPYARLSDIPIVSGDIQYTGQAVSPTWLYYDPTKVRIGGTTSATNVGVYTATFEPVSGYAWPDGTTDVKYIEWNIVKKVVPIPIPMQTLFNYTGSAQTVVFNNLDTGSVTITNASATNKGEYVVTATLNDPSNTIWSDDTYTQKAWNYEIIGMQNIITLSKDSVTFESDQDEEEITVSSLSGGTPTITVSDNKVVEATYSNGNLTLVPGISALKGTATITISVPATSVYEAAEATISVVKDCGIDIVTWAGGTDTEIAAMVAAADAGGIDLTDYWHVGDERVVHLSAIAASGSNIYGSWNVGESHIAQDVVLVLMDTDHYELTTPVLDTNGNQRTKCSFVVGLKDSLNETCLTQAWDELWRDSERYTWCNTAFAGAIPSTLISIFKLFKVGTAKTPDNINEIQYTDDLFSLFAGSELLGDDSVIDQDRTRYNNVELRALSQLEYYKVASNRIKKLGYFGTDSEYWTRSDASSRTSSTAQWEHTRPLYMRSNGSSMATPSYNTNKYGIAPFGCI